MSGSEPGSVYNSVGGPNRNNVIQTGHVYGTVIVYAGDAERTRQAQHFEKLFRQGLLRELDEIELFGLDADWRYRRYALTSAYVDLLLQQSLDGAGGRGSGLRFEDVVRDHRRILLEGDAGSGKSTALRYLAVRALRGELHRAGEEDTAIVPFLIKLRRLFTEDGRFREPEVEDFVRLIARPIHRSKPEGWVTGLMEAGRAMVFLDGIDEVPARHRAAVYRWLDKSLFGYFPRSSYVITSRPAAIPERKREELRSRGFVTACLEPMTPAQVNIFIDRWHEEMRGYAHDAAAEELKEQLDRRRDLARLARTPLMCAVMCALNAHMGTLPEGRVKLYGQALDLLVDRRDVDRRIRLFERGSWGNGSGYWRDGFGELAKWLTLEDVEGVPPRIAGKLMFARKDDAAERLQILVEQVGVFRVSQDGSIGFRHPGFRDLLAAERFVETGHYQHLVQNAHLPGYQSVLIMAVAMAGEELLGLLVQRAEQERPPLRRTLWLLAAACLAETEEIGEPLARRIRAATASYLPPKDLSESEELARAGDFVLDLLSDPDRVRSLTETQIPAVIRTAVLIDADEAVPLLRRFRSEPSRAVQAELVAGWRRSKQPAWYASEILRDAPLGDVWVEPPDAGSLPLIEELPALRALRLPRSSGTAELRGLVSNELIRARLEMLDLADTRVDDLTPLTELPGLRLVDISNVPASHEALADLPSLTILGIRQHHPG